jgi:hypothetical protein
MPANVLGGGPFNGYSPQQTLTNFKSSENVMTRKVLRSAWNTAYATGTYNNKTRIITPFRAINNSGDFLSRKNYSCGGPTPVTPDRYKRGINIRNMIDNCDTSGVPASSCNVKFVADSSDYIKFRKQMAINRNYNDLSNGGDQHNGSFVPLMAVRRR